MKEFPGRASSADRTTEVTSSRHHDETHIPIPPSTNHLSVNPNLNPIPISSYETPLPENLTIRQWLSHPDRVIDKIQSLHIFKQVLDFVNLAHGQGVMLRNIRPSCFLLSPLNKVVFIDSASSTRSGSSSGDGDGDDGDDGDGDDGDGNFTTPSPSPERVLAERSSSSSAAPAAPAAASVAPAGANSAAMPAKEELSGSSSSGMEETGSQPEVRSPEPESSAFGEQCFPQRQVLQMEIAWYTSPEEVATGESSFASDVYSLGVLMFELLCSFGSEVERARVMGDLRSRILPPRLLSECPKEASFCLRLLYPDPNCRPKAREIYSSDILADARDAIAERQAAVQLEEKEAESEVLFEFLLRVQSQKQENGRKLAQDVSRLNSDIQEVERKWLTLKKKRGSSATSGGVAQKRVTTERKGFLGKRPHPEDATLDIRPEQRLKTSSSFRSARFMSNFTHLENVYFSMNWRTKTPPPSGVTTISKPSSKPSSKSSSKPGSLTGGSDEKKVTTTSSRSSPPPPQQQQQQPQPQQQRQQQQKGETLDEDWLGCFFDSLCKYARYSRFEVKATLRHGDLLNTANMVCSLSFDRDEEYFATAGVCKRIKVFECDSILNEQVDIHYPVVEMPCRSKLSNVCWNGYIKSYLASCDYEGVVQLWDASANRVLMEYEEHEKRAWSVDFSKADPTKLASGSDDGTVKLWSINQESSIGTIQTKANVCSIQFPPGDSGHLLTFGSANYKVYVYDLRSPKLPLFVLASHQKAVSYVKFVDADTLVSASTDNTLKLWDLTKANATPHALTDCTLTYTGHTNEKNFIGLSIADGYIACGSESNAVFAYHKSLPMEMASHQFGCTDPITGREVQDDGGQFVSSVCWRGKSQTLVAANSMGNIKILEMV